MKESVDPHSKVVAVKCILLPIEAVPHEDTMD
jgi:hypothetical protein